MLRKILNAGFAGCLAAATACTGFAGPAQALPLLPTKPPVSDAYDGNIIKIQRGPKDQYGNPIYPQGGPQSGYTGGRGPRDAYGNPVGSNRYQENNAPQRSNRSQRVDRSQRNYNSNSGFYRHNGHAYYNGHRGYPYYRRGYRQYNGWWFPLGAFTFGTIIGPGYNYPSYPAYRSRGLSQAHYNWCYRNYRSYRSYDNTFQPYNGPRRACRSPYWP